MLVVKRQVTGPTRYRLLETLRGYAASELAASPENAELQRRHFGYYLALAEQIDRDRHRTESDHEVGTLVADEQNFRAALAWGLEHEGEPLIDASAEGVRQGVLPDSATEDDPGQVVEAGLAAGVDPAESRLGRGRMEVVE